MTPMHIPPGFSELELLDPSGSKVSLGELWRDGPIAIVWLRHYG